MFAFVRKKHRSIAIIILAYNFLIYFWTTCCVYTTHIWLEISNVCIQINFVHTYLFILSAWFPFIIVRKVINYLSLLVPNSRQTQKKWFDFCQGNNVWREYLICMNKIKCMNVYFHLLSNIAFLWMICDVSFKDH